MPESTPSFGGFSEDPISRATPAEAANGDIPVPQTASGQSGSDRDAASRAALAALVATRGS
eukprot:11221709-Lingulodinium_polyedra.AAC.1